MRTVQYDRERQVVRLIDQTALAGRAQLPTVGPGRRSRTPIREMHVRGAPAIGVTAAYGLALAGSGLYEGDDPAAFEPAPIGAADALARDPSNRGQPVLGARAGSRSVLAIARGDRHRGGSARAAGAGRTAGRRGRRPQPAHRARFGAELVPSGANILTHCNAGALATVDYGTALGVVRAAHEAGQAASTSTSTRRARSCRAPA